MSPQRQTVDTGLVELGVGGVIVKGDAAAASILGVAIGELAGCVVGLVDPGRVPGPNEVGSREMLDIFADLSSFALFSQDSAGHILTWNRGAERLFGYSQSEVVGGTLAALAPAHLRGDLEGVEHRVAAGERVDRVFTEVCRKDGMPVPIALTVAPIADSSGVFTGAVGVVQELTETRLAQAALAEVEQRFREWEALAHVGRWLWDVGTDAVQWSDELHRMHGVDPLDFEGTLVAHLSVVHPDDRERVRSLMEGAVASSQSFEDEYRVIDDVGAVRWFAMRAEPAVGSSGDVVGLRGVSHDITISAIRR